MEPALGKRDDAIEQAPTGPAISTRFDDVATLRMLRAAGRIAAAPLLKAGDAATAAGGSDLAKTTFAANDVQAAAALGQVPARAEGAPCLLASGQ